MLRGGFAELPTEIVAAVHPSRGPPTPFGLAVLAVFALAALALLARQLGRPLDPRQRLVPTRLFTLGGEFSIDNLTAKDAVTGMRIRGPIAQKIHDLPDGARIQFEVTS